MRFLNSFLFPLELLWLFVTLRSDTNFAVSFIDQIEDVMAHIQSRKIEPGNLNEDVILAGIAKRDVAFVIDRQIDKLKGSRSFRGAEAHFAGLLPFLDRATDQQIFSILKAAVENGQIAHASLCAQKYLPPLMKSHGWFLEDEDREHLEKILAQYVK